MLEMKYFLMPLICAGIGWFTNYLAVKMLFYPREPVRVLFLTFHGIFPKRKQALAENLATMIERELLSHDDIQKVICDPSFIEVLRAPVEKHVDHFINEKLPSLSPMVAMFLNDAMKVTVKEMLSAELDSLLPDLLASAANSLESRLDIQHLIRHKVENFSMDKIEEILFSIMKKEFRFIELVGGVLGFLIGVVQSAAFYWL